MKVLFVAMAAVLAPSAVWGQSRPSSEGRADIGAVTCVDETLTICRGGYCFVSFGPDGRDAYRFDFARGTYSVPSMRIADAPMRDLDIARVDTTFIAKFRIELAKPATVQFVRNVPRGANGATGAPPNLTAGRRIVYPATSDRAEIDAIAGMRCSVAGDP